jgi:hypothetical protein
MAQSWHKKNIIIITGQAHKMPIGAHIKM